MADYGHGAKAGMLSGVIVGIIWGLILFAAPSVIFGPPSNLLPGGFEAYWALFGGTTVIVGITGGVIGSIALGAIYADFDDMLPSRHPMIRGIILGIILWLAFDLLFQSGFIGSILYLILSFVFRALVFGVLLAMFYERFGVKRY